MRTTTAAFLATFLALANGASANHSAGDRVTACQAEARSGHARAWALEPSLRPMIDDHRARMSAACVRVATAKKADALAECLAEAARGPRHIQRGRNMDRDHIARQKELCRKLAAN